MIGKWNKSVILTYIGLGLSVLGISFLSLGYGIEYAMVCLMIAGVCDLFDGTFARMCKRTKEEKMFGVELDSLVDVFNFIAFPIIILLSLQINKIYCIPVYILYAICGVARLAHFNITTEDLNKPRKYYEGLPVTYAALLFPIIYLLSYVLKTNVFNILYLFTTLIIAILFIVKVKIPKPKTLSSIVLLLIAIILTIMYLFVL